MKNRSDGKFKLKSIEDIWGDPGQESTTDIELHKIQSFKDHPFHVVDDAKMQELVDSIQENGILTPVLVRPLKFDRYEMVSGHRRLHAATLLHMETIPAIVRDMDDDTAIKIMVHANVQRDEILPSEKAFAYKMLLEAMKRQAGRPKKNPCQDGTDIDTNEEDDNACQNVTHLRSDEELSEQVGESARNIQRYIRLTELIPELLEMVDQKKVNFTLGVNISYLPKNIQTWVYHYVCENGSIKPDQISALRKTENLEDLEQDDVINIMVGTLVKKTPARKVSMNEKKLSRYFPSTYSAKEMEQVIESLLEKWKQEQDNLQ